MSFGTTSAEELNPTRAMDAGAPGLYSSGEAIRIDHRGVRGMKSKLEVRETLRIDYLAEQTYAQIIGELRSTRLRAGISQNRLATGMPVRGRAISEWETSVIYPPLEHMILWADLLGLQLVLVDGDGEVDNSRLRPLPGESWMHYQRRRLALPPRNRRLGRGMSQEQLGELVGVCRDTVSRWELVRVPPRPIAKIVWLQKMDFTLTLRPKIEIGPRTRRRAVLGCS